MAETIQTKQCSKYKEIKPVSEFSKNRRNKDGLQYKCKQCRKEEYDVYRKTPKAKKLACERVKRYYRTVDGRNKIREKQTSKKYKTYQKKYRQGAGREKSIETCKQYKIKNREKIRTHDAIKYAVKKGYMPAAKKLKCFYCDKKARDYHHWHGYDKVYDVIPICVKCHKSAHTALVLISS